MHSVQPTVSNVQYQSAAAVNCHSPPTAIATIAATLTLIVQYILWCIERYIVWCVIWCIVLRCIVQYIVHSKSIAASRWPGDFIASLVDCFYCWQSLPWRAILISFDTMIAQPNSINQSSNQSSNRSIANQSLRDCFACDWLLNEIIE